MQFQKFNKIPRLSRDIIITEKINGSNAQIYICNFNNIYEAFAGDYQNQDTYAKDFVKQFSLYCSSNGLHVFAGSRNRWLDTSSKGDNFGFAKWAQTNAEELIELGEGRFYGEWFGKGIQVGYGLDEKRFALFNVGKWHNYRGEKRLISINPKTKEEKYIIPAPKCCHVVPILYNGIFDTSKINDVITDLKINGSYAVPGFMKPEGICIYHKASGQLFKKTILNDEKPKTV